MKILRFNKVLSIFSIFILIGINSNLSAIATPLKANTLDLLQAIDNEANATANTNKVNFELLINPVDTEQHSLPFHLELKSPLWFTNDEFRNLKNYLGDSDLSNALKIVRRKFFRRFHSQQSEPGSLKYKLLSALVFSSLQGKVNLVRSQLEGENPDLFLLVSDYNPKHKSETDWEPLVSNQKEFEFHVQKGSLPNPISDPVTVSSVYDRQYYENLIFNSVDRLSNDTTKHSEESKSPEETTQVNEPAESTKEPTKKTQEHRPDDLIDFVTPPVEPDVPKSFNVFGQNETPKKSEQPKQKQQVSEKPSETDTNLPSESPEEQVKPRDLGAIPKRTRTYDYRESRSRRNGRVSNRPEGDSDDDSDDQQPQDSSLETRRRRVRFKSPQSPKNEETQDTTKGEYTKSPQPKVKPKEVDNNVVDSENPVPTEELKSNEEEKDKTTDLPQQPQKETPPQQSESEQSDVEKGNQEPPVPSQNVSSGTAPRKQIRRIVREPRSESRYVEKDSVSQPDGEVKKDQATKKTAPDSEDDTASGSEKPTPKEEVENSQTPKKTPEPENVQTTKRPVEPENVQTPKRPTEPQNAQKQTPSDTISNVRKSDGTYMKTTFSLPGNAEDQDHQTKFYKKNQEQESNTSGSSESEDETTDTESSPENSEEQQLKLLEKRFKPYNETELMNMLQKSDTEDVEKDFKSPLTITFKINFYSSDQNIVVPVLTTARLPLPTTIFTMCISEELTQQCAFELKDRIMSRFEDNNVEAFKWARLVSLLQALAFQNDVFVDKYLLKKGEESEIEVSKRSFILPMKTLNFLRQLSGKASSSDNESQITFEVKPEVFNIPLGSVPSDLGQNYAVHNQMSRFLELYGDFEVTHSLFDLPPKHKEVKKGSRKPKTARTTDTKVFTMEELLSMNLDTKDLSSEIHFILSGYEKALFSVPKRLSGYKLLWETVEKYPDLQRIWIEALNLMKLMDKKDNLKRFLENHTFKYQELKDLFEITYGIIAADNFESAKEFYETVGITQKDVDTNLARVKSLFFSKTGSSITRLPPILKPMHSNCPVKNMITSLSSNDLIERFQVMYVQWLTEHKNSPEGTNYELAFLCSGSAVLLQHWHYFQLDQNYHDHPVPFITLITSFSRLAQGKYRNPERKKEIVDLINSKVAKICRKYINSAGILATTPYKTASISMTPKSLLGAIGNALSVSMDAPPIEVAYAMKDYFKAELASGKFGNSLGICMGLQLLYRLSNCLSVERSNDFSLYMHGLLTMNTRYILESYTDLEKDSKSPKKDENYINFACNPNNPTVTNVWNKLLSLVSTQSHLDLMEELMRREMLNPDLDVDGYLAQEQDTLNKDYVDLDDDTTTLLENFEDTNPRSLLEIADEVSYEDDDEEPEAEPSFIQQRFTHGGFGFHTDVVGMPNLDEMDSLYRKLFSFELSGPVFSNSLNQKVFNQLFNENYYNRISFNSSLDDDLAFITFDIRMEPVDARDQLIALDVPFSFHERELDLIETLESKALLRLLLYRIKKRIESLEFDLRHDQLKRKAIDIAKARNLNNIRIPVHENIATGNVDLDTYTGLLRVLESMPEDGYYFEHEGLVVPNHSVGKLAAKRISNNIYRKKSLKSNKKSDRKDSLDFDTQQPVLILQVIDPVDDSHISDLSMPHEEVKKHDKLFYEKMTEL